jgi:hypothetical protein
MTTQAIEQQRREIYEIAEAIAPTWERRRAYIEEVWSGLRASRAIAWLLLTVLLFTGLLYWFGLNDRDLFEAVA